MDLTGPIARRFPLLPRPRPPCCPLQERAARICDLARTAARQHDTTQAAAVFNQSALLASDCGLADLARDWCRQHAATWLGTVPLSAADARHALEPLVNLARLHIRDRDGSTAYILLDTLYQAVTAGADTLIEGIELPASRLTRSPEDHHELQRWIWAIHLAETPRALISAGRWHDALGHLQHHHAIGRRMLDGRQIGVITHCTAGDTQGALALLSTTAAAEPWEHVVTACLTVLCREHAGLLADFERDAMLRAYQELVSGRGLAVFRTRLGLTVIDAAGGIGNASARRTAHDLTQHVLSSPDGYAAREILAHRDCRELLTSSQEHQLARIAELCGLGHGTIPGHVKDQLAAALGTCEQLIRQELTAAQSTR